MSHKNNFLSQNTLQHIATCLFKYYQFKEKICIEIVNKSDNILYLQDKYYTPFLDLAVVYYIPINNTYKYFITHQDVILFSNIFKEFLYKQALENLHRESNFRLKHDSAFLIDENKKNISIAAILDIQLLNSVQKDLGTPFYILPQSIYELKIIPRNKIFQREELENLKKELIDSNDDLPADYIVSNHIYYYNSTLTVAI